MKNIGKGIMLIVLVEGKCDLVTLLLLFRMTIHTSYQVNAMLLRLCKVFLHNIYKTKGLENQGQQCYLRCAFNLCTLRPTDEATEQCHQSTPPVRQMKLRH